MKLSKEDLHKIFVPTKKQIFLILAATLVIFAVFEANLIFLKFTQNTIFSNTALQDNFSLQFQMFSESQVVKIASLVVFWGGVGLVAYSIIYSVYSLVTEARNETVVGEEYTNKANRKARLQVDLIQAGLLAGIVALGLLSLNVLFPLWISLMTQGIIGLPLDWIGALFQIPAALIGAVVNLYLFKVLISWILVLE